MQNDWNWEKLSHCFILVFLPFLGYSMDTMMSVQELLSSMLRKCM